MSGVALGIDRDKMMVFEAPSDLRGRAVWPAPFLSIASFIGEASSREELAHLDLMNAPMIFREDYFDPVARIRRGRLYVRGSDPEPAKWLVQRHPAYNDRATSNLNDGANKGASADGMGFVQTMLKTFRAWHASDEFLAIRRNAVLVLGFGNRISSYAVLDVERLVTGEELLTLRTRGSLGVLPELARTSVPAGHADFVIEHYEKAASAAFREEPESVIDRCREAATAALIARRSELEPGAPDSTKDLAKQANYFEGKNLFLLSKAAASIALMHTRGKASVQVERNSPRLTEGDAECALALLGQIYRELKWAM